MRCIFPFVNYGKTLLILLLDC